MLLRILDLVRLRRIDASLRTTKDASQADRVGEVPGFQVLLGVCVLDGSRNHGIQPAGQPLPKRSQHLFRGSSVSIYEYNELVGPIRMIPG